MRKTKPGQLTKPEDAVVPMTADGLVSFAAGEGFKITGKEPCV